MLAQNNLIIITGSVKQRGAQINKSLLIQGPVWHVQKSISLQHSNGTHGFRGGFISHPDVLYYIGFGLDFFIFSLPQWWWYYWLCQIFSYALVLCRKLRVHHAFERCLLQYFFMIFFCSFSKGIMWVIRGFLSRRIFVTWQKKKQKKKGWQIQQRDFWEFFFKFSYLEKKK
jgi:hypothetical protein